MTDELPPDSQLLIPDDGPSLPEVFGRYRIVRRIGQGAMGAVFLAADTVLVRQVALKVRTNSATGEERALERFRREARYAAVLQHPNICPVYDVGEIDGIDYIALAYLDGVPLSQLLAQGPLPGQQRIARIVRDIASALHHAHQRGVVHRDLKPANIMIDREERPILMDFGIAARLTGDPRITRTGALMGTPAYMAHEQVHGNAAAVGPSVDIYSLGVILYEMLTGQWPFPGNDPEEIFHQLAYGEPRRPRELQPDIDGRLETICLKMIARQPEDRYASMQHVVEDLDEFLTGSDVAATWSCKTNNAADPFASRAAKCTPSRKQRIFGAVGAVLFLSMIGGIAVTQWLGLPNFRERFNSRAAPRKPLDGAAGKALASIPSGIPEDRSPAQQLSATEPVEVIEESTSGAATSFGSSSPSIEIANDPNPKSATSTASGLVDRSKRWFVGIGVDRFHEKAFAARPEARTRIEQLARALGSSAGFETRRILSGEEATAVHIRQLFCELAQTAEAGVTLCIVVDGLMNRVPDVDGDDPDGWDEAFVAFDSEPEHPETFVTDDEFRNFLAAFSTERLIVLLDLEQPVFAVTPEELVHREPAMAGEFQQFDAERPQRAFSAVAARHRGHTDLPADRLLERLTRTIQARSTNTLQHALEQACGRQSASADEELHVYGSAIGALPIGLDANHNFDP